MARTKLHISTVLMAVLLASLVGFSSMMCLADAFSMQCSMGKLAAVCGAASVAAACMMLSRKSWILSLAALFLWAAWIFWKREPMEASLMAAVYAVSREYAACYSGVTVWGQAGDCLPVLSALAMPFCWLTGWTVCKEGSTLFLLLLCAPVWILCLIIVELAPVFWLILLTFSLLVLLLSHSVRERNANEGSRLAWWLLLPAVILVGAVTIIWPPADYERAEWSQAMQTVAESGFQKETLQELGQSAVAAIAVGTRQLEQVDLSRVGPKRLTGTPVLECLWPESRFYLRGNSLGYYGDNGWAALDHEAYAEQDFAGEPLLSVGTLQPYVNLQIRTKTVQTVLYTTYYPGAVPGNVEFVDDAYIKNLGRVQEYQVFCSPGEAYGGHVPNGYDNYVNENYTQVPDELRAGLEEFLAQKGWNGTRDPELLADMVRGSGVYDLNTPRLPAGEEFVLYFLQESNRGYCVHFATAATMLLRTAGIPARYVTGYSVTGNGTDWVTVTEDDAHAWVEYYVNGVGWLPLDPTPAADDTQSTPGTVVPEQPQQDQQQNQPQNPQPDPEPDSVEPDVPAEQEKPAQKMPQKGENGLWWLVLPAFCLFVQVRRWLIVRGRNRRCTRGRPNQQALALWRWLWALGKRCGVLPEEELFRLAEKARFSQHTLTEEELGLLRQAVELRITQLKQQSAMRRFWLRYGLVLY